MVNRVIIDSTAASPLRVSVAGVDAALAEFNNLIFDGNQSPLRLSAVGYVSVNGITYNERLGGKNTNEGAPTVVASSPAGTTPIWISSCTTGNNFLQSMYHNNNLNDGAGCAICQSGGVNYFIPVNHNTGIPSLPDAYGQYFYINYAIMKNWT